MNLELLKQTSKEDYERKLSVVLKDLKTIENESTGLFHKIINTDRQILYACMGKILSVSQSSVLQNRNELYFFASICQLFNYYMYDDGRLTIKYERYHDGIFIKCNKKDKRSRPFLSLANDSDRACYEKEIIELIEWHENHRLVYKNSLIDNGFYDGSLDKKEFIDYNN